MSSLRGIGEVELTKSHGCETDVEHQELTRRQKSHVEDSGEQCRRAKPVHALRSNNVADSFRHARRSIVAAAFVDEREDGIGRMRNDRCDHSGAKPRRTGDADLNGESSRSAQQQR